jgi:hypothetical protein
MRRKTQIVLAITFMVAALVTTFSYIYIAQILRQQIATARETSSALSSQLAYLTNKAVPDLTSTKVDTNDPKAVRRAITYYLSTDSGLNDTIDSVAGVWPTVYDAAIVDADGKAIVHSNEDLIGKQISERPAFQLLLDAPIRRRLQMVYSPLTVYEVRTPLQVDGAAFGSIRLGISITFLKNEVDRSLRRAAVLSGVAILLSLILAAGLSHLALDHWSESAAPSTA